MSNVETNEVVKRLSVIDGGETVSIILEDEKEPMNENRQEVIIYMDELPEFIRVIEEEEYGLFTDTPDSKLTIRKGFNEGLLIEQIIDTGEVEKQYDTVRVESHQKEPFIEHLKAVYEANKEFLEN